MAKTKRQRRKHSKKTHRHQQVGASVAKKRKNQGPSNQRNELRFSRVFVFIAVGILLSSALFFQFSLSSSRDSLQQLPNPNLSGAEAQVAQKIVALRTAVENDPGSAEAWGKLGMSFDVHDLKSEAIACYEQAAQLNPSEFRWPYYCAMIQRELGSSEALAWFEHSLRLNSSYGPLLVQYGQSLFDAGRLEESSQAYQRALRIDAKLSHAHLGLAEVALRQGDLQSSREHLLKALEITPGFAEAHGLLAQVYRRMGDAIRAEQELRQAQSLPAITPMPDPIFAVLAREGVSVSWYRKRARAYAKKGLREQALYEYRMALRLKPEARSHYELGAALQALKKHGDAIEQYQAAIALKPDYVEALDRLAAAYAETGDFDKAIAAAQQAHRLATSANRFDVAGQIQSRLKSYEENRSLRESM